MRSSRPPIDSLSLPRFSGQRDDAAFLISRTNCFSNSSGLKCPRVEWRRRWMQNDSMKSKIALFASSLVLNFVR